MHPRRVLKDKCFEYIFEIDFQTRRRTIYVYTSFEEITSFVREPNPCARHKSRIRTANMKKKKVFKSILAYDSVAFDRIFTIYCTLFFFSFYVCYLSRVLKLNPLLYLRLVYTYLSFSLSIYIYIHILYVIYIN